VSLLLISHTPEIQASLADRLMVMSGGAIVEQGSFDQLHWNPAHECTKAMLRASDKADGAERKSRKSEREIVEQGQLVR